MMWQLWIWTFKPVPRGLRFCTGCAVPYAHAPTYAGSFSFAGASYATGHARHHRLAHPPRLRR